MPRKLEADRTLFVTTLALCLTGAVMVFSASAVTAREQFGSAYYFLWRQLVWFAAGLAAMFGAMHWDYRRLRQPKFVLVLLSCVLFALIGLFFLDRTHQTHRWIRLGPVSFQPSEIAKLAVILFLAWFLEIRSRPGNFGVNDLGRTIVPALGVVFAVAGLVLLEPDLGTAVEICLAGAAVLFVAGLSPGYIFGAAAALVPAVYMAIMRVSYRQERILAFLHPEENAQGAGFQLMQSLIAVGSGGFSGVGLMESRQKLFFLPEAHTDFIYAVICEELGFIGGAIVLALFAVYAWRGLRAAMRAPDEFGSLLALGITFLIASQALVNLAVVLGMMPTKGIPLPFISYGGSSLFASLLATGVLLNIGQQGD